MHCSDSLVDIDCISTFVNSLAVEDGPSRYPLRPQNILALVRPFTGAMYCFDSLVDIDGITTFVNSLAVEDGGENIFIECG